MTERDKFEISEKKEKLYYSRGCHCEVCGKVIKISEAQIAHRISKGKANLNKYGPGVIHHPLNLVLTCSDKNSRCNDSVNIGFNPGKILDLLSDISKEYL